MALAAQLSRAQFVPTDIRTDANVAFEKNGDAFAITGIELVTSANVPGIDDATFQKFVADAKQNCPVSKALAAIENATFQKFVADAKQNCPVSKALAAIEIRVKATLEQTARSRSSTQMATADRDDHRMSV